MHRGGLVRTTVLACAGLLAASCSAGTEATDLGTDLLVGAATSATATPHVAFTPTDVATDPVSEAAAGSDRDAAPAGNASALRFTAPRLGGGTVTGTDHAGGDVVLWMWAHWCPQCNEEAADVAAAAERFDDRVTFIGVPEHADEASLQAFVDRHGLDDLVHAVDDEARSLWSRYGINYQPAWVFIDEDGDVDTHAGPLYDDLEARVQTLVDQ